VEHLLEPKQLLSKPQAQMLAVVLAHQAPGTQDPLELLDLLA
jgi:hypothetical protein